MPTRAFYAVAFASLAATTGCGGDGPTEPDPSTQQYDIQVRFFGTAMSASQQALFTNAANRIQQIITGDIIAAAKPANPVNLNQCPNVDESIQIHEQVDDVIIYASIRSIDGPGKILASAGPCFTRPTANGKPMTAIGVMSFDSADLNAITQGGSLQDVITHEMLHVVGVGTLWALHGLIQDTNTANPRYMGAEARAGCVAAGGTIACANHVPVEGNAEPVGTRDAHWRESTFDKEMLTGFLDSPSPLSGITVGALKDLGFTIDASTADAFTMGATGPLLVVVPARSVMASGGEFLHGPVASIEHGRVIPIRRR